MSELEMWLSVPPFPSRHPAGTCDMGQCERAAVMWTWCDGYGWLPSCGRHGEA